MLAEQEVNLNFFLKKCSFNPFEPASRIHDATILPLSAQHRVHARSSDLHCETSITYTQHENRMFEFLNTSRWW